MECNKDTFHVNCIIEGRYCGLCCMDTEMPLSPEDCTRIKDLGYNLDYFSIKRQGTRVLKNKNGRCVFLAPSNRCSIYPYRPEGCRLYPVVLDLGSGEPCIDDECPKRHELERRDLEAYKPAVLDLVKRAKVREMQA